MFLVYKRHRWWWSSWRRRWRHEMTLAMHWLRDRAKKNSWRITIEPEQSRLDALDVSGILHWTGGEPTDFGLNTLKKNFVSGCFSSDKFSLDVGLFKIERTLFWRRSFNQTERIPFSVLKKNILAQWCLRSFILASISIKLAHDKFSNVW